jgi:uncharacterized protein YjbJ (UPF0337 family)
MQTDAVQHFWVYNRVGFLVFAVVGQPLGKRVTIMGGKTDVVKGRIKEAAGVLTGNDRLRSEGKADQAVGKVKQAAERAVGKIKQAAKKNGSEVVASREQARVCLGPKAARFGHSERERP